MPQPPTRFEDWRDIVLFFGGLGGVFYEALARETARPTLVMLYAAMLGLPAALYQKRNGDDE